MGVPTAPDRIFGIGASAGKRLATGLTLEFLDEARGKTASFDPAVRESAAASWT
jgi:hypothetical protein